MRVGSFNIESIETQTGKMADVLDIENQDEFEEFGVDEDGDRKSTISDSIDDQVMQILLSISQVLLSLKNYCIGFNICL